MSKFFDIDTNNIVDVSSDHIGDIDSDEWMPKMSQDHRNILRDQYKDWLSNKRKEYDISDKELKDKLLEDLTFVCSMSSTEYTLYRKFLEIKQKYPNIQHKSSIKFFDNGDKKSSGEDLYPRLKRVKNNIWRPNGVEDYKNLKPTVIMTNDSNLNEDWNILRTFIHTQVNNSNIGRNLYFIVMDEITGKYLGLINVSSDFLDLTPRDKYIGWDKETKTHKRMINHTAIASTIVPTQPLGFNYVGGKLIALLSISNVIEESWNKVYDTEIMPSKLVGMTTTSLYSSFSQYQNLKYWNKRGHSAGSIRFEPSRETLREVKRYLETYYPLQYWEWYLAVEPGGMPLKRDFKQRSLNFIYSKLDIEKKYYETNHSRGIYFCPFYENMKEYLRMEIKEEELIRRKGFDNNIESLVELWKNKYAKKRVESLKANNRLGLDDFLFYDDIVTMTWEETKEKYLNDVGR